MFSPRHISVVDWSNEIGGWSLDGCFLRFRCFKIPLQGDKAMSKAIWKTVFVKSWFVFWEAFVWVAESCWNTWKNLGLRVEELSGWLFQLFMPKGDYGLHEKETFKTRLSHQKSGRSDVIDWYWKKKLGTCLSNDGLSMSISNISIWVLFGEEREQLNFKKKKTSIINPLIDQPSAFNPLIDQPSTYMGFSCLIPLKLTMKLPNRHKVWPARNAQFEAELDEGKGGRLLYQEIKKESNS